MTDYELWKHADAYYERREKEHGDITDEEADDEIAWFVSLPCYFINGYEFMSNFGCDLCQPLFRPSA